MTQLSSYPNVYNTCLVLLQRRGYKIAYEKAQDVWVCEKDGFVFRGDNPIELLGLTSVYQDIKPSANVEYWWQISSPNILAELDPER
jgi:hypothetical protein